MKSRMEVNFPGGKRVDARIGDMIVHTDQSRDNGGEGTAPEPFTLFLVSLATCAGVYALEFCQSREVSTEGMGLTLSYEWNEEKHRVDRLQIDLKLPAGFPERYRKAVIRSMDLCTVKKHIVNPPEFIITAG